MKRLIKYNAKLFWGFICSILLIVSYFLSWTLPEWWPGAGRLFEFIYQMSTAYSMSYIFYVLQVYMPAIKNQKKAFAAIESELSSLGICLMYIKCAAEDCFDIEEDTVTINDIRQWIFTSGDSEAVCAIEISAASFTTMRQYIEKKLHGITTNSIYGYSDESIMELMGKLQGNRLLDGLIMACQGRDAGTKVTIQYRKKDYLEFRKVASEVWALTHETPPRIYRVQKEFDPKKGVFVYSPK